MMCRQRALCWIVLMTRIIACCCASTDCTLLPNQPSCAQHVHCLWGNTTSTCGKAPGTSAAPSTQATTPPGTTSGTSTTAAPSPPATTPSTTAAPSAPGRTPAPANSSVMPPTASTSASLPSYGTPPLTTPAPDTEYLACGVQCRFGSVAWGVTPGNCTSMCGDGLRSLLEACDDGNAVDGDGCSASCLVEEVDDLAGVWVCEGLPSSEALMDVDEADASNERIVLLETRASAEEAAATNAICRRDVCKIVEGLSVAAAEFTAQVVSATVGTTIAVVTSAVAASSLASSVAATAGGIAATTSTGTGAGAATAAGAAGAGMGPLYALVDQAQFLAIIGRVGGSNATEETLAFARGLDWINFSPPFDIFGGSEGASGARRLWSPKGCGGCDSCLAIRFGEKLVVSFSVLCVISSIRALCCYLYMRHYPDEAAPPDFSFPNWEGPVFILELFGLCDVSVELVLTGVLNNCLKWTFMGALVLCLPLACLALGFHKCYYMRRSGDFEFKKFEHRTIKTIYTDSMQADGWRKKVMTLLVDLHDKRFVGDWGKKSDEAKRWGFLLANTAGLWFCFTLPLIKKLAMAVIVNIPNPIANTTLMTIVFWTDLVAGVCVRAHRDHFVNFSGAVVGFGNFVALILVSVKVIMPALHAPQWLQGPTILMLTASMTAIGAVVALLEPVAAFLGCGSRLVKNILNSCGCLVIIQPVLVLLRALRVSLVSRFQRIFFTRSKQAVKENLLRGKSKKIEDEALALRTFRLWRQKLEKRAICSSCGKEAAGGMKAVELGYRRCSICKFAIYCSDKCQQEHVEQHSVMCLSSAVCTLKLFAGHVSDSEEQEHDQKDHRLSISADIVELPIHGEDKKGKGGHSEGQIGLVENHHPPEDDDSSVSSAHSIYSVASDANPSTVEQASTPNQMRPGFFKRHNQRNGSSSKFGSFKAPDGTSSRRFGSFRHPSGPKAHSDSSQKNVVTDSVLPKMPHKLESRLFDVSMKTLSANSAHLSKLGKDHKQTSSSSIFGRPTADKLLNSRSLNQLDAGMPAQLAPDLEKGIELSRQAAGGHVDRKGEEIDLAAGGSETRGGSQGSPDASDKLWCHRQPEARDTGSEGEPSVSLSFDRSVKRHPSLKTAEQQHIVTHIVHEEARQDPALSVRDRVKKLHHSKACQ